MSSLSSLNERKVVIPASKINAGMIVGVPSLGIVPTEFALSIAMMHMPINFGVTYISPSECRWDWTENKVVPVSGQRALPVADARNVIAASAIASGAEWLFFRDDDTIAPPDTINRLFYLARSLKDKNVPWSCVGGNYMSKQCPPHSLILVKGYLAGFEDWEMGDIVGGEETAIGMGCTLIPVDVLRKMEPPWFKTVDSLDPEAFIESRFAGGMVKTGNDIPDVAPYCARMTEDVYFCRKAARYGFTHVYCDTSVQCVHVDINSGRRYFYHGGLKRGVWQDGQVVNWYMKPGERFVPGASEIGGPSGLQYVPILAQKPDVVRFDLGTPNKKPGWITVDLFEPSSDEQVDIRNMRPLIAKYGMADEIRASHIWEHFPFRECVPTLAHWTSCLKPGGRIFIEVPDAEWGMENLLRHKDSAPNDFYDQLYKLIGFQSNAGDFHKCLFTKGLVEKLLKDPVLGLDDVKVEWHSYPDVRVQRAIRASATRKAKEVHDGPIREQVLADAA